ncbi:MAG: type 1 glutamine amidotransferase [Actinomycetota bacterium]|nr:type 1 glutamine amidotransferase [Actinomycetota bacterium]MDQ6934270.1 type 1 glutamine amidotransferase [Actinomycetota bacterium]
MPDAGILVVEHEPLCSVALFGPWLGDAGAELDVRRPYAGDPLPDDLSDHDALLVMGGSMGADDDAEFGWLSPVKELIRRAAADSVPSLGICLGHQLAAVALGGSVGRNPNGQQLGLLEVGWLTAAADDELTGRLRTTRRGIQWNDDIVVKAPVRTTVLARATTGEIQAARFAPTVWGVQLHPEADADVIEPWTDSDRRRYDDDRVDVALREIAAAVDELERGWRPLADSLVGLAAASRVEARR